MISNEKASTNKLQTGYNWFTAASVTISPRDYSDGTMAVNARQTWTSGTVSWTVERQTPKDRLTHMSAGMHWNRCNYVDALCMSCELTYRPHTDHLSTTYRPLTDHVTDHIPTVQLVHNYPYTVSVSLNPTLLLCLAAGGSRVLKWARLFVLFFVCLFAFWRGGGLRSL